MTITLTPETVARLQDKAQREGGDVNAVAEALIATALDWEAQESAEAIAGVRRGEQAAAEGRERPLAAFVADQRARQSGSAPGQLALDTLEKNLLPPAISPEEQAAWAARLQSLASPAGVSLSEESLSREALYE